MNNSDNKVDKMPAPPEERLSLISSMMWDYDIPPEHCLEVLEGKRATAGHYTEETLFRKLLESYRWFTVLKILPPDRILELLTDELINSLRFKSLSSNYAFIRKELSRALHSSG